MFRVIVAGSRDFNDYDLLRATLDKLLVNRLPEVLVVSGGAPGADQLGERYAIEHDLDFIRFPADWKTHGRSAGYKRNEVMAQHADAAVVFWLHNSPGSRHMIDFAQRRGLAVRVIKPEGA